MIFDDDDGARFSKHEQGFYETLRITITPALIVTLPPGMEAPLYIEMMMTGHILTLSGKRRSTKASASRELPHG